MNQKWTVIESVIVITIIILFSLIAVTPSFKANTYNKVHGTSFTWKDFMFGSEIIMDYQGDGKIQTHKLKIKTEY